jgi:mRNA-degrading endonuclease RelE of RelBE toxin-antitoxin system
LAGVETHLRHQPTLDTRRLKSMQPNPVSGWELRLGDFRVLYDVDEAYRVVTVHVVGEKKGNRLFVQGQEFSAHEGD